MMVLAYSCPPFFFSLKFALKKLKKSIDQKYLTIDLKFCSMNNNITDFKALNMFLEEKYIYFLSVIIACTQPFTPISSKTL